MAKLLPSAPSLVVTNSPAVSNSLAASGPPTLTNAAATNLVAAVPPEKVDEYRRVCGLLDTLSKREQEMLVQYTPESSMVKSVAEQIAANEKRKTKLEEETPGLLAVKTVESKPTAQVPDGNNPARPDVAVAQEAARVAALQSKIKFLTGQLDQIRTNATAVYEAEGSITELQRRRELEEGQYQVFLRQPRTSPH